MQRLWGFKHRNGCLGHSPVFFFSWTFLANVAFVCIFLWYVFTVHLRCTCCEKLSHYVGIFFLSPAFILLQPPSKSLQFLSLFDVNRTKEINTWKKIQAVFLFYFGAAVVTEYQSARSKRKKGRGEKPENLSAQTTGCVAYCKAIFSPHA